MRLTPPTKNNFYFSFLMLIMGIAFYVIGTFEAWRWWPTFVLYGFHWFWFVLMGIFLLMAWLLLILGCAWKGF